MDLQVLEELGFTSGEIKVYVSLLKTGPSPAGKIISKENLQNSVFHFNINRLINKGFVSYTQKGGKKIYFAKDPENIFSFIKEKEARLVGVVSDLKSLQNKISDEYANSFEIFVGFPGITTFNNTIIANAKKGEEYLFYPVDNPQLETNKEIVKYYKKFDIRRKVNKILAKAIIPTSQKKLFSQRTFLKTKVTDSAIPSNKVICGDYVGFIDWQDDIPRAILIRSKQIANVERKFFNYLWNIIK